LAWRLRWSRLGRGGSCVVILTSFQIAPVVCNFRLKEGANNRPLKVN